MTPAEAMQSHLAEISEDLALAVETIDAMQIQLDAMTQVAEQRHDEVMDAIAANNEGAAKLHQEMTQLMDMFKNYVTDTAKLRSEVRRITSG